MLRRILFAINLLRAMPAYCAVCLSGAKKLICAETEGYMWFLETYDGDRFPCALHGSCGAMTVIGAMWFPVQSGFHHVQLSYQTALPAKEGHGGAGEIGEGLGIYHGHGTVIAPTASERTFPSIRASPSDETRSRGGRSTTPSLATT